MTMKQNSPAALSSSLDNPIHVKGTIHILSCLGFGGPVVYAFMESEQGAKECLVEFLLNALARLEPKWSFLLGRSPISIKKGFLGRPHIFADDTTGPSLSFSHVAGQTWTALSGTGSLGIDVAFPAEFNERYPYHRTFRNGEFESVLGFCDNNPVRAAALLWSLKEAAVKALGCGFNRFDPLEVQVGAPESWNDWLFLNVIAGRSLPAWARQVDQGWLSIALAS